MQIAFLFSDFLENDSTYSPVDYEASRKHSQGIVFACPTHNCSKTFSWKGNLSRHLRYECNVQPRFQCPHCQYRCKVKSDVGKHIVRRHKGLESFVVDLLQTPIPNATRW